MNHQQSPPAGADLERTREIHTRVMVIDAHVDIEIPGRESAYVGDDGRSKAAPDKMVQAKASGKRSIALGFQNTQIIGTDFNHGAGLKVFDEASDALNVTLALLARGYSENDIDKIWGRNFLRALDAAQSVTSK
jgi:microsomal dipeptidase-like Zn-dependent dipeptidase